MTSQGFWFAFWSVVSLVWFAFVLTAFVWIAATCTTGARTEITPMNLAASLERLRKDAANAALTRDLVPPSRRALFDRAHQHIIRLADEVEQAMKQAAHTGRVASRSSGA